MLYMINKLNECYNLFNTKNAYITDFVRFEFCFISSYFLSNSAILSIDICFNLSKRDCFLATTAVTISSYAALIASTHCFTSLSISVTFQF